MVDGLGLKNVKIFVVVLLMVLLFSFFAGLAKFPAATAQSADTFTVSVSCSEVMRLRGQSVNIFTVTNASSFRQEIVSPSGMVLYNQSRTSNFTFTVPFNAAYGMYTVRSVVAGQVSETWLSVLDVSGWQTAGFPYVRSWKNVAYTFYANGTIKADQGTDTLEVDLSTLRGLVQEFNLDVAAYSNSMNFRVRFSKALVAVDLTFSFIHTGLKFTINGSTGQPRVFSFNVKEPAKLKAMFDMVRSGNLVFDYGDLRRAAQAFSYESGVLMVNIPANFMIDPTIFSDGFESGDFTAWTSITGSPEVVTTYAHHGTYSEKINNATAEYATKTFGTTYADFYARCYAYFTSLPTSDAYGIEVIKAGKASNWAYATTVRIQQVSGVDRFGIRSGAHAYVNGSLTVQTGQWYCIELHRKTGSGNTELFIDGNLEASFAYDIYDVDTLYLGGEAQLSSVAYLDCVVAADAYIGPESSGAETVSLVLNQPANASTINAFACNFNYTPTLVGSGSFQNASLFIDGVSVANNASAISNATLNTIAYTFAANGTYLWDVRVYNSTAGVFSSNGNFTVTVAVYVADTFFVDVVIVKPENATYNTNLIPVNLTTTTNGTNPVATFNIQFPNASWLYGSNQTFSSATTATINENLTATFFCWAVNDEGSTDNANVTFTVSVVLSYPVTVSISSPSNSTFTVDHVTLTIAVSTNGTTDLTWYRVFNGSDIIIDNTTYTGSTSLTGFVNGTSYKIEAFSNNTEGYSDSGIVMFSVELGDVVPVSADDALAIAVVALIFAIALPCAFLAVRRKRED